MISTCHLFLTSKHSYPRSPSECSSGLLWNHKQASQGHFHSGVGRVVDLWLRHRSASFAFHQYKIFSPLCEISSLWHYNFLSRVSISQDAQPELVSAHVDSRSRPFVPRTYDQIVIKLSKNEIEVQNVQDVNRIRLPFFTYWDKAS